MLLCVVFRLTAKSTNTFSSCYVLSRHLTSHQYIKRVDCMDYPLDHMNGRKEVPVACQGGTQTTMKGLQPAHAQSGRQSLYQPRACLGNPAE